LYPRQEQEEEGGRSRELKELEVEGMRQAEAGDFDAAILTFTKVCLIFD
jgi:hypothetical protein